MRRECRPAKSGWLAAFVATAAVIVASPGPVSAQAATVEPITLDSAGAVGERPSVVLDANDNPVMIYHDSLEQDLRFLRCNDPACSGGDDLPTSLFPLASDDIGSPSALALDTADNPVIVFVNNSANETLLLRCNDPACSGGDDTPVVILNEISFPSLALDAADNPVVAYSASQFLRVLHCNDPACAGGDDRPTLIHLGGFHEPSMVLDASGNPVVAFDEIGAGLRLVHCNDPDCAGGDDAVVTVDATFAVAHPSLALDAAGNPVIAYHLWASNPGPDFQEPLGDLRLVHCNDPDCAGEDDVAVTVDSVGYVGWEPSLALNRAGHPVIAYRTENIGSTATNSLKFVYCNDPDCAGGDDVAVTVDSTTGVVRTPSLVLDGSDNAVIAYFYMGGNPSQVGDLRLLRCDNRGCLAPSIDTATSFEELALLPSLHSGHSVVLRLYWAALDRRPELGGAQFWLNAYNSGQWDTRRIAAHFVVSEEFVDRYGDPDNSDFTTLIYANVLDREPDTEGFAFWKDQLDRGMSRAEMVLLISNDDEFIRGLPLPSDARPDTGPLG